MTTNLATSHTEPIEQWFRDVMKPLVRRCRHNFGQFTVDDTQDWWALLRRFGEQHVGEAIAIYLSTAKDQWMPMPGVIVDLAAQCRDRAIRRAIAEAPDCEICRNTGTVDARAVGGKTPPACGRRGRREWRVYRCTCVRGAQYPNYPRFDPLKLETERQVQRLHIGCQPVPPVNVQQMVRRIGNIQ